jgi:hypothetical protein
MKKLLWIKDYKEFWEVFNQVRMKERRKLRALSFRKKLEIMGVKPDRTPCSWGIPSTLVWVSNGWFRINLRPSRPFFSELSSQNFVQSYKR